MEEMRIQRGVSSEATPIRRSAARGYAGAGQREANRQTNRTLNQRIFCGTPQHAPSRHQSHPAAAKGNGLLRGGQIARLGFVQMADAKRHRRVRIMHHGVERIGRQRRCVIAGQF